MLSPAAPVRPVIDRTACPSRRHGTATAYVNHGCRCADARAARKHQQVRAELGAADDPFVPAIGTRRRREALLAAGFTPDQIGAAAGLTGKTIRCMASSLGDRTRRSTHDKLAAAYRTLCDLPRPTGARADAVRRRAAQRGYHGPEQWPIPDELDDPAAVPDSAYRLDQAAPPGRARARHLTDDQIDTIRDLFRRAAPYTFDRTTVAADYRCRPETISDIVAGRITGYTDLRPSCPDRWKRPALPPQKWTDSQIDDVRARYLTGQDPVAIWRATGIHHTAVHRMIRGRIRPARHLTDLTAHPRGANSAAASPADSDDRKEVA
jgi:hypothetical protein